MIKILCLGDVVRNEGVSYLERGGRLRSLRSRLGADLVIVNGENSAEGNGLSKDSAERILDAGADVITGGNHTWHRSDVYSMLDDDCRLVRPANYPSAAPGMGYRIADARGYRVLVANVCGTAFMDPVDPPHTIAARILEKEKGRYDIAVCDIHAEATSEKLFFARYFDEGYAGALRFSAIFGTHTHIPTADCSILPGGTGYVTDLGMCGSGNGILGLKTESIIHKFTVRTPNRFESAIGNCKIEGCLFTIDEKSGKCTDAARIFD